MNQPLLFKQLQTDKRWMELELVFPEILPVSFSCFFPLSLECVSGLFLCSFFLRVWDWTASVLHANEQNVSGKVVQKQRTHLLLCLFFPEPPTHTGGQHLEGRAPGFADYFSGIGGFFSPLNYSVTEVDTNYNQQRSGPELPESQHYPRCDPVNSSYL